MSVRLEFFPTGNDQDVILLYGGSLEEVRQLRHALGSLRRGPDAVRIHDLPFVESIGGCGLTAAVSTDRFGVKRLVDHQPIFEWTAPTDAWNDTAERLEPFGTEPASDATYFQYLSQGTPLVIYSTQRAW